MNSIVIGVNEIVFLFYVLEIRTGTPPTVGYYHTTVGTVRYFTHFRGKGVFRPFGSTDRPQGGERAR